jgi:MerR family transcriptional regulator, thiopeptide resistance regulator
MNSRYRSSHLSTDSGYLQDLRRARDRLDDRIESVETTIEKLNRGEALMAEEMLNGFDHSKYREEVLERWGKDATSAVTAGGAGCRKRSA